MLPTSRAILVAIAAVGALVFPANANGVPAPDPGQPAATVVVRGRLPVAHPWKDTGIDISAGYSYRLDASGTVNIYSGRAGAFYGPDGKSDCFAPWSTALGPGLGCYSLIGRVDDYLPFQLGSSQVFTSTTSGRLYVTVNDESPQSFVDNSGSWTVEIGRSE